MYVQEGSNQTEVEFEISSDSCGTEKVFTDKKSQTMENVIIIQNNPIFQEQADLARLIACRHSSDKVPDLMHRRVIFKPYMIDNLEVVSVPFQDDEGNDRKVDLWMDITLGVFPDTENLEGPVKVGDNLTLSIYVRDSVNDTDIRIKDCYAYDNMKSAKNNQKPAQLQLSEENGCPLREQLLGVWSRTYNTMDTKASIIAYNNLKAFKFPERDSVFLACNIDLCKGNCTERCELESENPDEESQQGFEPDLENQEQNSGNDYDDPNTIDSSFIGIRGSIGSKKERPQEKSNFIRSKRPSLLGPANSRPNNQNLPSNSKSRRPPTNRQNPRSSVRPNQSQRLSGKQQNNFLQNRQQNGAQSRQQFPLQNEQQLPPQNGPQFPLQNGPQFPPQNGQQFPPQNEQQFLPRNRPQFSPRLETNENSLVVGKSVNEDLYQQPSVPRNSIAKKNNRKKLNKKLASQNKQFGPAKKFNSPINFNQNSVQQMSFQQTPDLPPQSPPQQISQQFSQPPPQQQLLQQFAQSLQQLQPQLQGQPQIKSQPKQQSFEQANTFSLANNLSNQLQPNNPQNIPKKNVPSHLKRKIIKKKINKQKQAAPLVQPDQNPQNLKTGVENIKNLSYLDASSLPLESPKPVNPLVSVTNSEINLKAKEWIISDAISSAKLAAASAASQPKISYPQVVALDKIVKNQSPIQAFGARQSKKA